MGRRTQLVWLSFGFFRNFGLSRQPQYYRHSRSAKKLKVDRNRL